MTLASVGLLVQWTDPMAIGAAAVALVLLAVVAGLLNREGSASAGSAGASGAQASASPSAGSGQQHPQPASSPQQLKQRAQNSGNPLAQGSGDTVAEMLESDEIDDMELLSQFVHDSEGTQVGETMTVTADEVVIKQDGDFLAVEPEVVIEKDGRLVLDPNVDLDEARDRGETWREANLDRMEYDDEGLPET